MQDNSSQFFQGPKPGWERPEQPIPSLDEALPPQLADFTGPQRKIIHRIAATHGTEFAFLIAAMNNVLEAPASYANRLSEMSAGLSLAKKNLYALASCEDAGGYRARYEGAEKGEFNARLVCIPGADALLGKNVTQRFVLGLVVPEYAAIVSRAAPAVISPYFASLSFDISGGSVLVSKIEAPLWNQLSQSEKERFAAWPKALLMGLDDFVRTRFERDPYLRDSDPKGKPRRSAQRIACDIFIARTDNISMFYGDGSIATVHDSKTKKARYAKPIMQAIADAGYSEPAATMLKPVGESHRFAPKPDTFLWKRINLSRKQPKTERGEGPASGSSEDSTVASSPIRQLPSARSSRWVKLYHGAFPIHSLPHNRHGEILNSQPVLPGAFHAPDSPLRTISQASALAPFSPLAPHLLKKVTDAMLEHHQRSLEGGMVRAAIDRLPRFFAPISAGPRGNARQNWAAEAAALKEQGEYIHLPDQNRHPSVRFQLSPVEGSLPQHVTVGFKGGGYLHTDGLPLRMTKFMKENELHSPILINPRLLGTVHTMWGGFGVAEAETEYMNLLGTSWLMHKVAPRIGGVVAEPIDYGFLEALPVWNNDGSVRWMSITEHKKLILGQEEWEADYDFGMLRSVSPSDVRLSQAVNDVFFPKNAGELNVEQRKHSIDEALSYIYAVHGHQYQKPGLPLPVVDGKIGPASVALYLQSVAEMQSNSARAIFRSIQAKSYLTMSAIHAIGGHLGGIKLPGEEGLALRAGPLALRNVDCDGRLHDIDHFCYLPIAPGWSSGASAAKSIRMAQALDIVTLQDTMYWTRLLLGQRKELPHGKVVTLEYGPKFSVQVFRSDAAGIEAQITMLTSILEASKQAAENEKQKKKVKRPDTSGLAATLLGSDFDDYEKTKAKVLKVLGRSKPNLDINQVDEEAAEDGNDTDGDDA